MDDTILLAGLAGLAALAGVVIITSQDGGGGGGAGITPQRIPEEQTIVIKKGMKATKPAPAPQPAPAPVQRSSKKKSHIWKDTTGHILVGNKRRNTDITMLKKRGWEVKGYDRNTGRVYLKSKSGVTKFVDRSGRQWIKKGNKIMSVRTYLESLPRLKTKKKKKKKEND